MTSLPEEMPEHVVHEKFLEQILEDKEEIDDSIHKIIVESKYTQTISPRILKTLITHCQSEVLLVSPCDLSIFEIFIKMLAVVYLLRWNNTK